MRDHGAPPPPPAPQVYPSIATSTGRRGIGRRCATIDVSLVFDPSILFQTFKYAATTLRRSRIRTARAARGRAWGNDIGGSRLAQTAAGAIRPAVILDVGPGEPPVREGWRYRAKRGARCATTGDGT